MQGTRLNGYRNDIEKLDSVLACKNFQQKVHNFNIHTKFIIKRKLVIQNGRTFSGEKRLYSETKIIGSV